MTIIPTDLSNQYAWFKADAGLYLDAGVTPVASDGNLCQEWQCQFGSGRKFTQTTSSKRGLYKPAIINGKPVIRLDATDDGMQGFTIAPPYTIAIVYAQRFAAPVNGVWRRVLNGDYNPTGGLNNWLIGARFDGGGSHSHYAMGWAATSGLPAYVQNQFVVAIARNTGARSDFFVNNVTRTTDGSPIGGPATLYIGSSPNLNEPPDADIAEIIVYNAGKSDDEVRLLGDYLGITRYALWAVGDVREAALYPEALYTGTPDVREAALYPEILYQGVPDVRESALYVEVLYRERSRVAMPFIIGM